MHGPQRLDGQQAGTQPGIAKSWGPPLPLAAALPTLVLQRPDSNAATAQPADRLKQLAARSRGEKLRAAARQLKATSPTPDAQGGAAAAAIEVAAPAQPADTVAPLVSGLDSDLDLLLDEVSLGLDADEPWAVPYGSGRGSSSSSVGAQGRRLSQGSPGAGDARARRALAKARAERMACQV